jgi:hypothetical protein
LTSSDCKWGSRVQGPRGGATFSLTMSKPQGRSPLRTTSSRLAYASVTLRRDCTLYEHMESMLHQRPLTWSYCLQITPWTHLLTLSILLLRSHQFIRASRAYYALNEKSSATSGWMVVRTVLRPGLDVFTRPHLQLGEERRVYARST